MIGPNAFSSQGAKSYIQGKVKNPNIKPHGGFKVGWLVLILVLMTAAAVFYYVRHNKKMQKKQTVTFENPAMTLEQRQEDLEEKLDERNESMEESREEPNLVSI